MRELFAVVDAGTEMIYWRRGRCVPYGDGRTFWALREIVRAHAGILETHDADTAAELLESVVEEGPDHGWLCDRLRPLVGLDAAEAEPRQNYAAWLRFLRDVATRRPLVLVVEDLHWADEALLAFLEYVSLEAAGVPLLTIATARPAVFEHHPSFAASGGRVTRMWLERLSDDETHSLVASRPEMGGRDPATVELVVRSAEGNPFFAEELASLLAERASGDYAGGGEGALPQSVQAVIAARIDALSPPAKSTLADGAVIGVRFWRGPLLPMGGRDAAAVDESLRELVDRQLLRAVRQSSLDDEDEFVFRHGMIREVAYHELPRGARAQKHAVFARWLEARWVPALAATSVTSSPATSPRPPSWREPPATRRWRRRSRTRPSTTSRPRATGPWAWTRARRRSCTLARWISPALGAATAPRSSPARRRRGSARAATASLRPRCWSRRSGSAPSATAAPRRWRRRGGPTSSTPSATRG